ncbi:hypothetical protein D3C86_2057580 [compost metagenome]
MVSPGRFGGTHQQQQRIGGNPLDRAGLNRHRALLQRVDQLVANAIDRIEIDNLRQGDRLLGLLGHVRKGAPGVFSSRHIQPERFKNC